MNANPLGTCQLCGFVFVRPEQFRRGWVWLPDDPVGIPVKICTSTLLCLGKRFPPERRRRTMRGDARM